MEKTLRFDSLLVHGGLEAGPAGATSVPIVQSSSFAYKSAEELEDVFRGRAVGQVYTRIGNPTTESLERRLALLDGGVAAIATASGMAAITTAVLTILRAGDEILSSSSLFGGTFSLFRDTLSNYGITARFVNPLDLEAVRAGVNERTRLLFVETIGNPKLDVPDIPALAAIAHEAGLPLMVDATVTTPYLANGAALGADIVIHSTSKYINGSGTSIGGVIIDRGSFDWDSPAFPHFEQFHKKYRAFAFSARARKLVHKDVGACAAPMNSFLLTEGIQTLALRMDRHCENALKLARFLSNHNKVSWVNYPGLEDSPQHEVASRLYGGRYGGLLTFGTGDKASAFRVINGLRLAKNLANIGDAKTLVIHPASTICCDYSPEEKGLMGVTEDLIRVSVGIEDGEDIVEDFKRALDGL
ncbi:O-acetylhomoserine aminocarboxypropyltransferase/cysteine synthase family protein [Geobacter sp. SVR]|uniref:O-acetylhomoserine aminocarboxypropyltransferase/cysteine synthase family protein n=1 Tax=Geobacter sp. SVR TaxID=2495594 RepID=UPI00143EF52C|nr:O-acetylhomoserine aminocarboxypropyltransferase/cysteine synthase family protein [Geobacter sp. SVR]BCS53390.1 O-acetylhomoserine aminocarboxypropyltransferase [Geobacter sp. SVR]GCF85484.1 O-acetylhomoserine aminocarboxypropyltransferase [Geobacter sp. SVR]